MSLLESGIVWIAGIAVIFVIVVCAQYLWRKSQQG